MKPDEQKRAELIEKAERFVNQRPFPMSPYPKGYLEVMADFALSLEGETQQPVKCPVCVGRGIVKGGFYQSTGDTSMSTVVTEPCRQCNGIGILYWKSEQSDSFFPVKALRKRGANLWYWFNGRWITMPYPDNHDDTITMYALTEYYKHSEHPLPEDAELVEIECRIKTIEP